MAVLRPVLWWGVPVLLVAVAAFELSLVLRGQADERAVTFVGILVVLVGAGLAALALRPDAPASALALFAPTDDGAVRPAWMFFMAGAALVAGVVTSRQRRIGAFLTFLVLLVLSGTAVLASDGH